MQIISSQLFSGRHIQTLSIADGDKFGMLVTPDGRFMAVTYYYEQNLRVYRIEADGTLILLHTVSGKGAGPLQFNNPSKLCLAANGNVLVCAFSSNRVQELTALSEVEPEHVRHITGITQPNAIATHSDVVAVGTGCATVVLLSYATGAIIRTFGSKGSGRGNIGTYADGLRFTSDGQSILVAEYSNKRLSMFRVSDGALEDFCCEGRVSDGYKDVEIAPNGEIVVADYGAHRICVFSADGHTLLRTWGATGVGAGQFKSPTALALIGKNVFVLDRFSARVQVFE